MVKRQITPKGAIFNLKHVLGYEFLVHPVSVLKQSYWKLLWFLWAWSVFTRWRMMILQFVWWQIKLHGKTRNPQRCSCFCCSSIAQKPSALCPQRYLSHYSGWCSPGGHCSNDSLANMYRILADGQYGYAYFRFLRSSLWGWGTLLVSHFMYG